MKLTLVKRRLACKVKVTDCNGVVEHFDSVRLASNALKCTPQYVYLGLRTGRLVSGCKVEIEEEEESK